MMDVLNMRMEEIEKMDTATKHMALDYAWKTYNLRRVDLPLAKMFDKHAGSDKGVIKINKTADDIKKMEKMMASADSDMTEEEKESFKQQILKKYENGEFLTQ